MLKYDEDDHLWSVCDEVFRLNAEQLSALRVMSPSNSSITRLLFAELVQEQPVLRCIELGYDRDLGDASILQSFTQHEDLITGITFDVVDGTTFLTSFVLIFFMESP